MPHIEEAADFGGSPFVVQALQPHRNAFIQPLPVVFSSRVDRTTLGLYERTIQIERSDSGMVYGDKVYAMEHSIFDPLKETECSRGFAEDGVCWVRMAKLDACADIEVEEYLLFLVTVVGAETTST